MISPKPSIYLETSVVSYLAANLSRVLLVAAHQQVTREWWEKDRKNFDIFISQIVVDESQGGSPEKASERIKLLRNIPLLNISDPVINLAGSLVASKAVPQKAAQDALHIAVASVHEINYLLTWNCKHIANAKMRNKISVICEQAGYPATVICTPIELGEL